MKLLYKNNKRFIKCMFCLIYRGGMTNYLYLCSLPEDVVPMDNEPKEVLMRIYGEIVDLKQRFYESIIFTMLSERNVGPKSYGVFYSGRLEQYYPVSCDYFLINNLLLLIFIFYFQ